MTSHRDALVKARAALTPFATLNVSHGTIHPQDTGKWLPTTPIWHQLGECLAAKDALALIDTALAATPADGEWQTKLAELTRRLEIRLNDYLCEMKPDYDDSITGFNEAWDIMSKTIAETLSAAPVPADEISEAEIEAARAVLIRHVPEIGGAIPVLREALRAARSVRQCKPRNDAEGV